MKRILVHDFSSFHLEGILGEQPQDIIVVSATPPVAHCVGCYGCWMSTPGLCVKSDRAQRFAYELNDADELIIVSRLCYGSYSPDIKALIDRSIPNLLPFFEIKDGKMVHERRSGKALKLRCFFYSVAKQAPDSALISDAYDKRSLIDMAKSYENDKAMFVGEPSEMELKLMHDIVKANAFNMGGAEPEICYVGDMHALKEVRL